MPAEARASKRFAFWCYVGVLAAAAAVSQAEENWLSFAVVFGGIIIGLRLERAGKLLPLAARTPLGLLATVLFAADFLFYSRGVILTVAHVIIMTVAIYLASVKRPIDYAWLFVQGLVLLSAAGASTFDVYFLLYTCIFVVSAVLFGYHALVRQAADGPWRVSVVHPTRRRARAAGFIMSAIAVFLVVGTAAFLLLPRYRPFGFTSPFIGFGQPLTGFSPEVSLDNGVGNLLDNPTLVFRAKVLTDNVAGESPVPLYWRGVTLAGFTGNGWRKVTADPFNRSLLREALMPVYFRGRAQRRPQSQEVRQEIMLEHLSADNLFVLPGVTRVESPMMETIRFDPETGDLYRPFGQQLAGPCTYNARSRPLYAYMLDLSTTRFADYDPADRYLDLTLDTSKVSPEIIALADRVVRALPTPYGRQTPYERVVAIRTYLVTNYEYTTYKSGSLGGATPVDDFLFTARKGHCEYFASAMALMCRAVGVPARVVNGFLGGEYNSVGSYYSVIQSNAHSWTEVYFPGAGWLTFDATPAAESGVSARAPAAAGWREYLRGVYGYVRYRWIGTMASYSSDSQSGLYASIGAFLAPGTRPLGRIYTAIADFAGRSRPLGGKGTRAVLAGILFVVVLLAGFFFLSAVLGWLAKLAKRSFRRLRARRRDYPEFYAAFLLALQRKGFLRRGDETPLELAARAASGGAVSGETADRVVRAYYRMRFGGAAPEGDEMALLESLLHAEERSRK